MHTLLFENPMRKLIQSVLLTSCLLGMHASAFAQVPAAVKQGPSGIFIFLGKEVPAGKSLASYKVERSQDNLNWKQLAEIKTPKGFDGFSKAVEKAKTLFPSQPLPSADKLSTLYNKAVATGTTDSLKGMRLLYPVRVALGIMYYDTSAQKQIAYRYRISAVKPSGEAAPGILSDTVSLPYQPKFDTINYSSSSYNSNSLMIKWKSAGKNPAPLFMVFKFRYGAPVQARGTTSRFAVNDTTYFVYTDSVLANEAGKEMQFFIAPYDHFGNSGLSSQVAVITQDNFNKANFVRSHIAFKPLLSGVQICWHFTDPVTVKTIEIYRSEVASNGFRKLTDVPAADTSFLDQQIWPERTYYYYVQAVAKAGKRTKQDKILKASVPGIVMNEKLNAPVLRKVAVVNGNMIRLLVEVNDTSATHIRVYRNIKGGLVSLPVMIETARSPFIAFTDSTLAPDEMKDVFYAVRNEKPGAGISSLSDELPVSMIADPEDVAYFYAFPSKGGITLFWDDVANRKSSCTAYALARKYGQAGSKSPLKVLDGNMTGSSFIDNTAQDGNQYTYELRLLDKNGNASVKSYTVTIPQAQ